MGFLDLKKWEWVYFELPFTIIDSLSVTDDYVIISSKDSIYYYMGKNPTFINKKTYGTFKPKFAIEKLNMDIRIGTLIRKSVYKNYVLYKNFLYNDIYIINAKLKQIHKIFNTEENVILLHNYKIIYFNLERTFLVENTNIKIHNLPISNLFEKCVYWIDETKIPDIAKKRVIDYRRDYLIMI